MHAPQDIIILFLVYEYAIEIFMCAPESTLPATKPVAIRVYFTKNTK
jgi:hypothetical protein